MTGRSHFYESADGLRLHLRIHGELGGNRLPAVCLPGLTRNGRDFAALADFLATEAPFPRPVLAFDYRGRGLSDRDPDPHNYNPAVEARDVVAGLDSLGIGRASFIGTSRGGLILHLLAESNPELLQAVVLNDVGPELGPEGLAEIRTYLANPRAARDRAEAAAAQRSIHRSAFPALSDPDWARMAWALYREQDGRPVPDYDARLVRPLADLDLTKPLPDMWKQFARFAPTPLLVIRGANSKLLTARTLAAMQERHPSMQALTVAGQGHAPFLETADLPQTIAAFLDDSGG